ncbi:MAG: 1-deoxy-D-xylulose-5-phosphate synthase [Oscillospiraceae bacterium]
MKKSEIKLKDLELPGDLKKLDHSECVELCKDIRRCIIKNVLKNGGHLASNLGTVELTVALHRVFDSPKDKLVWDVGHQAYAHKLLTGRYDKFSTLRKKGGISGFIRPNESEHDAFVSGHSSNSISAALGMAEAMRMDGDTAHRAVAIIGDGAFTGGLAYEGLNNAGKSAANLIVILNHNDMSISKNVGALAKYLTSIRGNQRYLDIKKTIEHTLDKTPVVGKPIKNVILSSKSALKNVLYHSTMFEDLGFVYLGPVDGHNIEEIEETLRMARRIDKPVFIHVNTVKGKGFMPAEKNPGAFHSIPSSGYSKNNPDNSNHDSFSENFGRALCEFAETDDRICAVTAAMKYGTGLQYFSASFPKRFFDVGIAEEHAVTFSAGLAKQGKIPVFAVYSSFLQRAYDEIIHDVAIDNTHIVLAVDRSGFIGEDGETHQGIFDIPMLTGIPNAAIYSPSNYSEQKLCLKTAIYDQSGFAAVRYPKGNESFGIPDNRYDTDTFCHITFDSNCLVITFGRMFERVLEISRSGDAGDFDILKLVKIFPIEDEAALICMNYKQIIFYEESSRKNGIAEQLLVKLFDMGYKGSYEIAAASGFIPNESIEQTMERFKMDKKSMTETIGNMVKNIEN